MTNVNIEEIETGFHRSKEFQDQLTTNITALHAKLNKGLTPNEYEKSTTLIDCYKSAQTAISKLENQTKT